MADSEASSDLIEVVHHEHDHLLRLFDDIGETFEKISRGELEGPRREEVLETASEDLQMALEEMLHHFNQEEEVFFVEIEKRFPDKADDIEQLASSHELMCDRTRWLHRQLNQSRDTIAERSDKIMKVVKQMRELLGQHTTNENQLFDAVLESMPVEDRESLLADMRRI